MVGLAEAPRCFFLSFDVSYALAVIPFTGGSVQLAPCTGVAGTSHGLRRCLGCVPVGHPSRMQPNASVHGGLHC